MHDSDVVHREEILKMERKDKKLIKQKQSEIDNLTQRIATLEEDNTRLNEMVTRQNRVIDSLTTRAPSIPASSATTTSTMPSVT